jgi:hypothetical protein
MLSPNELREKAEFLDGKNFGKSKTDEIVAELCRQVANMVEIQQWPMASQPRTVEDGVDAISLPKGGVDAVAE